MTTSPIIVVRYVFFGLSLAFSAIVVGLAAHLTYTTTLFVGGYFTFAAMGIAAGGLTMIWLTTMLIFGSCGTRKSFPTLVVVELTVLSILWVLWIATGGLSAVAYQSFFGATCGWDNQEYELACQETTAITAFSFLTWILLMTYTITLLVFAIIGQTRGRRTFTSSVMTTNFLGPKEPRNKEMNGSGYNNNNNNMAPQFTGQSQQPMNQQYTGQTQYSGSQQGYPQQHPQQQMYPNSPHSQAHPGVPQV